MSVELEISYENDFAWCVATLESFYDSVPTVSTEGFKETIKVFWGKLLKVLSALWERITALFSKLHDTFLGARARIKSLRERIAKLKKENAESKVDKIQLGSYWFYMTRRDNADNAREALDVLKTQKECNVSFLKDYSERVLEVGNKLSTALKNSNDGIKYDEIAASIGGMTQDSSQSVYRQMSNIPDQSNRHETYTHFYSYAIMGNRSIELQYPSSFKAREIEALEDTQEYKNWFKMIQLTQYDLVWFNPNKTNPETQYPVTPFKLTDSVDLLNEIEKVLKDLDAYSHDLLPKLKDKARQITEACTRIVANENQSEEGYQIVLEFSKTYAYWATSVQLKLVGLTKNGINAILNGISDSLNTYR